MINSILKWYLSKYSAEGALNIINGIGIRNCLVPGGPQVRVLFNAQPGDLLLIRAFGEATTTLIDMFQDKLPGGVRSYTHLAVVSRIANIESYLIPQMVDATGHLGVAERYLQNSFPGISQIYLGRFKLDKDKRQAIANRAIYYSKQKIPYDYNFGVSKEVKDPAFCTELGWRCCEDVCPGLLELRDRDGVKTITPNDVRLATRVISPIYEWPEPK